MEMTRREFLRLLGRGVGAWTLLAGGLGGLLTGCKEQEVSHTVATVVGGPPVTSVSTTSTVPSTTVVSGPEHGRALRIGLVTAYSGPLALFGKAEDWCVEFVTSALPEGIVCADGKLHPFEFVRWDCGSRAEKAAGGAVHLVTEADVDLLVCSGDIAVVNAVADVAEELLCPCLCNLVEWHAFALREKAPDRPLRFSYAHAYGVEDVVADFLHMWEQVPTNRKVGLLVAGDKEGRWWTGEHSLLLEAIGQAGYEVTFPEPFPVSMADFTAYISEFQKNGCEICCAISPSADFVTFWRQALALDYRPKTVTAVRALLFPQVLAGLGSVAHLLTAEAVWLPSWPFSESLTGRTCRQLADDYMRKTGEQWTPALAQLAALEWAIEVFKRSRDVDSEREFVARLLETRLDTCLGPIDFTEKVTAQGTGSSGSASARRVADTVYKAPVAGVQWEVAAPLVIEARQVSAVNYPLLKVAGAVRRMEYGGE